ncbi:MAG: ATP-dependent zinc metalloprotease FtsH [Microgenomates group bacterium GW2011_GWA2_44_7]|nr:MAG: ATP-dependent zinc metalloprotease FtsH [Microgenomates group bacterium GW2011_GWA2_44_7]
MVRMEWKFQFGIKNLIYWGLIVLFIGSFFFSLKNLPPVGQEVSLTKALEDIKANKVKEVDITGDKLTLTYQDNTIAFSRKEENESFVKTLEASSIDPKSVKMVVKDQSLSRIWIELLGTLLPLGLMVVFFWFIFRQARGSQDTLFSFGQSKAKLFAKGKQSLTFKDIAGVNEAKKELEEIVDFLKNPSKYRAVGARTPKGVLLVGPSGVGKTLLARAVAGEAAVPFFSMAGSEFMEMLVGVGAARVRDLFGTAKKSAPSIIFIDEIDAIGRMRGYGIAGGHDEREQTLNQILVEMDGFTPNDNVVIVAATNRGDLLDPALLRPGRFDRRVTLDMPDLDDRKAILGIHSRGKPMTSTIDWERIAKRTVGFSGADLENMLNEAAILAARNNRKEVTAADVEEAALKVKLGPEKKRLQTDHDRKMTAYHEAGHALVSYYLPNMDPVHRISIVSRGITLGQTVIPPSRDRIHETKSHLVEQVASMMGGRAAEDLVFKEFTTGASSDIDQATRVARSMVMEFGMSDLGPINLGPQMELTEWGRMWNEQPQVSQQMQNRIDQEVKKIVDTAYQKAVTIIKKFRKKLDLVAEELLKKETLESEDFERIMGGAKVLSNPELAFIKAKK